MIDTLVCVGRYKKSVDEVKGKKAVPRGGQYTKYILQDNIGQRRIVNEQDIRQALNNKTVNISNLHIDGSDRIIITKQNNPKNTFDGGSIYLDDFILSKIDTAIRDIYSYTDNQGITRIKRRSGGRLSFRKVGNLRSYIAKSLTFGMSVHFVQTGLYKDICIIFSNSRVEIISESGFTAAEVCNGVITSGMMCAGFDEFDLKGIDFSHIKEFMTLLDGGARITYGLIQQVWLPDTIEKMRPTKLGSIFYGIASMDKIECLNTSNVTNISNLCNNAVIRNEESPVIRCLNTFDLSNVTTAIEAFSGFKVKELDLRKCKLDTSKLINARSLFYQSEIERLILNENFDSLEYGGYLFCCAEIDHILNTSEEKARLRFADCNSLVSAFDKAKLKELAIDEINIKSKPHGATAMASNLFKQAIIEELELSEINLIGNCKLDDAFFNLMINNKEDFDITININGADYATLPNLCYNFHNSRCNIIVNFNDMKIDKSIVKSDFTTISEMQESISLEMAFNGAIVNSITLHSNNDIPFITKFEKVFRKTSARKIDMSTLALDNLISTYGAFDCVQANIVNMGKTKTKVLECVEYMFHNSIIENLIIGDWSEHRMTCRNRQFKYYSEGSKIHHKQGIWIDGTELSKI